MNRFTGGHIVYTKEEIEEAKLKTISLEQPTELYDFLNAHDAILYEITSDVGLSADNKFAITLNVRPRTENEIRRLIETFLGAKECG